MDISVISTIDKPILSDACVQTDTVDDYLKLKISNKDPCDSNTLRRKLLMDSVTEKNETCLFWTCIPKLSLLNYIFKWITPCAKETKLWMRKKRHKNQTSSHI